MHHYNSQATKEDGLVPTAKFMKSLHPRFTVPRVNSMINSENKSYYGAPEALSALSDDLKHTSPFEVYHGRQHLITNLGPRLLRSLNNWIPPSLHTGSKKGFADVKGIPRQQTCHYAGPVSEKTSVSMLYCRQLEGGFPPATIESSGNIQDDLINLKYPVITQSNVNQLRNNPLGTLDKLPLGFKNPTLRRCPINAAFRLII